MFKCLAREEWASCRQCRPPDFKALAAADQVAHGEGAGTSELADASIAAAATAITFLP
jgi:hypothetical protein